MSEPTEEQIQAQIAAIKADPWHPRGVRYGEEFYRGAAIFMLTGKPSMSSEDALVWFMEHPYPGSDTTE